MAFLDAESMEDFVPLLLFVLCALLVALLVWVLLRRRRHAYRAQRDAEGTTTGEQSLAKRPSMDVQADGAGMPSGARITPDANGPAGTGQGPRLVSGSDSERAAGAGAFSTPSGEATSKGAPESFASPTGLASKELSSERATSGLSSVDKHPKGGATGAHASKSKRRKDGGSRSSGGGGTTSSSRRASVQRSQASSLGKAGKSSSSELPAVPALLIRRPSTDSKSSQRSSRSTRYVGDKPKVPPALDIFSREHSSMAESPPSVMSPPLDAAPKTAQGPNEVPSPAADKPATAP
ncbi:uncharacterized protein LOC144139075 [Haemaphysalis longicornis]